MSGYPSEHDNDPPSSALDANAILDAMQAHIAVIDRAGVILKTNVAWRQFAQENDAETLQGLDIGANYIDVTRRAAEAGDILAFETLIALEGVIKGILPSFMLEYPCHSATQQRWFLMLITPLKGLEGAVIVHENITLLKEAETRILDDVSRQREDIEMRSRFVSMASHEFRTPLASIMTATEMVLRYRPRMNDERIDAQLRKVIGQVKHMNHLIDDMLTYGKAQTGRLQYRPERVDISTLTHEILDDLQAIDEGAHGFVREISPDLGEVVLDTMLWRMIVTNLMSNALKFSQTGSSVSTHLSRMGSDLCFQVKDEGIGILSEEMPYLFEAFYRASNRGDVMGTGLGLSIVKYAVELHGGKVEAKSELGEGTLFTIKIPAYAL